MDRESKWIYYPGWKPAAETDRYGRPSPYFRKEFAVAGQVKRAILRVTALGICKVSLNGRFVDEDRFVPGWTDYRKRIYYEEYDVTDRIGSQNCLSAVLGDGWYAGILGSRTERNYYGDTPMFRAALLLELEEGARTIVTGGDWKCSLGEILGNDFFNGEIWDARERQIGYDAYGFDDTGWLPAAVSEGEFPEPEPAPCERVRVAETLRPVRTQEREGKLLFDFGQNFAGVLRVTVRGERGSRIVLRHGEMLRPNGGLYTGNLRTAAATDTYILAGGGEEVFEPLFTYHGFRYAEASLEGKVQIVRAEGLVIWSELKRTGLFRCDNEIISQVYSNALWGQKSNFVDVPTDCPQRDERMGWTGDTQVFAATACYLTDASAFYEKYLYDMQKEQNKRGGCVPDTIPAFYMRGGCCVWGDAATILPWTLYLFYGDVNILRTALPSMRAWVDYIAAVDGDTHHWRAVFHFGDWLARGGRMRFAAGRMKALLPMRTIITARAWSRKLRPCWGITRRQQRIRSGRRRYYLTCSRSILHRRAAVRWIRRRRRFWRCISG